MISFENDYSTGAHPRILEALAATNLEPTPGYGGDRFCESAAARIRTACDDETADVFFLTGGTQTNAVVISALLAGHEGVIAADTGHIAVHEAGAIEATGHKVLTVPESDGKLRAADVEAYLEAFYADASYTHMVFPGMVFIAHPSELGTLYSLAELEELSALCRRYQIPLYLDGARLAYGLAAPDTDVTLADIARLADAFYIGGTKCGALCGEAVVFPRGGMPRHFLTHAKQHGALLAKGRLLGVQFDTLFTDDLYGEVGRTAAAAADELRRIQKDEKTSAAQRAVRAREIARRDTETLLKKTDAKPQPVKEFVPLKEVQIGQEVVIADLGQTATVTARPDRNGMVEVRAGIMKTKVPLTNLRAPDKMEKRKPAEPRRSTRVQLDKSRKTSMELNLLGYTVDEALNEVDKFLDSGMLRGQSTLYIIHGNGTGALRTAIQKHLRTHKAVKSFRLGRYGEGESGVTVVELK